MSSFDTGFIRPNPDAKSGKFAMTGNANVGDVANGKTFYNTTKQKQTGNGSNVKRFSSGSGTLTAGKAFTVTGLGFTPSTVNVSTFGTNSMYYRVSLSRTLSSYSGYSGLIELEDDSANRAANLMTVALTMDASGFHGTFFSGATASQTFVWEAYE